jgi:hypothetical protein
MIIGADRWHETNHWSAILQLRSLGEDTDIESFLSSKILQSWWRENLNTHGRDSCAVVWGLRFCSLFEPPHPYGEHSRTLVFSFSMQFFPSLNSRNLFCVLCGNPFRSFLGALEVSPIRSFGMNAFWVPGAVVNAQPVLSGANVHMLVHHTRAHCQFCSPRWTSIVLTTSLRVGNDHVSLYIKEYLYEPVA